LNALTLKAGPEARRILRERGLHAEGVDVVLGASGGPKWLILAGLDRFLFGTFLAAPRARPLHLIGASIGSWRLACLAQLDPVAALERAHEAYVEQRYPPRPSIQLITETTARILDVLLGEAGVDEVLGHPSARLHVVTAEGRGLAASERRGPLALGLGVAALTNAVSRRALGAHFRRTLFHAGGDPGPPAAISDLPTLHVPITRENLRAALLASASIPLVLSGVRVPGAPGLHRDGGVIDYHPDLDLAPVDGLVLFPHFYPHVVQGWFDKALPWRRADGRNFRRALLLAPSPELVASLPRGKIPDRNDFYDLPDEERIRAWRAVVAASEAMGDELRELIATGRLAERVDGW